MVGGCCCRDEAWVVAATVVAVSSRARRGGSAACVPERLQYVRRGEACVRGRAVEMGAQEEEEEESRAKNREAFLATKISSTKSDSHC